MYILINIAFSNMHELGGPETVELAMSHFKFSRGAGDKRSYAPRLLNMSNMSSSHLEYEHI